VKVCLPPLFLLWYVCVIICAGALAPEPSYESTCQAVCAVHGQGVLQGCMGSGDGCNLTEAMYRLLNLKSCAICSESVLCVCCWGLHSTRPWTHAAAKHHQGLVLHFNIHRITSLITSCDSSGLCISLCGSGHWSASCLIFPYRQACLLICQEDAMVRGWYVCERMCALTGISMGAMDLHAECLHECRAYGKAGTLA
jgi:hypothetical protein